MHTGSWVPIIYISEPCRHWSCFCVWVFRVCIWIACSLNLVVRAIKDEMKKRRRSRSEKGCVVLCCLTCALTVLSWGPPEAKKERPTAVMPEAILERQKYSQTNKYIQEAKWHQKPMQCNTWVECGALLLISYSDLVKKKNEQKVLGLPVTNLTLLLTSSPSAELAFRPTRSQAPSRRRNVCWLEAKSFRAQSFTDS